MPTNGTIVSSLYSTSGLVVPPPSSTTPDGVATIVLSHVHTSSFVSSFMLTKLQLKFNFASSPTLMYSYTGALSDASAYVLLSTVISDCANDTFANNTRTTKNNFDIFFILTSCGRDLVGNVLKPQVRTNWIILRNMYFVNISLGDP